MNDNQKIVFDYLKHKSEYLMTAVCTLDGSVSKQPNEVEAAYRQLSRVEEAFVLIALGNYIIQEARISYGDKN